MSSPKVLSLGEPLIQLNAINPGPLRHVTLFEKHVAGSEANFCVASVRFGCEATLIARVGVDEFGHNIVEWLRGKGVDVSRIVFDPIAPTGVYFVQRHYPVPYKSELVYYRKGSAGSRLNPDDVDERVVSGYDLLHITGITLAISESARLAVFKALKHAKRVSMDTNIRLKLWPSKEEAREVILRALERVEILITDADDAAVLFGVSKFEEVLTALKGYPVRTLVFKRGTKGVVLSCDGKVYEQRAFDAPVEDPTGAGDALSGAFCALYLRGFSPLYALKSAVAAATLVVSVRGDQEAIPSQEDAERFLKAFEGQ